MTEQASVVSFEVLGSLFSFHSEDPRWAEWVTRLWPAFITGTTAEDARFELTFEPDRTDRWTLRFDGLIHGSSPDAWFLANQMRYQMVTAAVRGAPGVLMHAGVVARGSDTTILAGRSGTGKTTLCLDLFRRGWGVLGDDLAPIDMDGNVPPFPAPFSVKDTSRWGEFSHTWADFPWLPEPGTVPGVGFLVEARHFEPADRSPRRPTRLVFAEFRAGARLSVDQLSAAEALALSGQYVDRVSGETLDALRRLCTGIPTYRIEHGGDAAEWLSS